MFRLLLHPIRELMKSSCHFCLSQEWFDTLYPSPPPRSTPSGSSGPKATSNEASPPTRSHPSSLLLAKKKYSWSTSPPPSPTRGMSSYSSLATCLTRAALLPFSKLIRTKSDRAMQSSSTPRSPPSFVPKSPSKLIRSKTRIGMMHRWKLHSSQSQQLL